MTQRVGAVVQARMSSQRLPGKVMTVLAGRPALAWVLERLEHATEADVLVVATSDDPSDDPVAAFCAERGTPCHRGSLYDVAARVVGAARAHDLDALVRVNGDSPLLDQRLVDRGIDMLRTTGCDLATNVRPRTFPPGQSVEVVLTDALERAHASDVRPEDGEHVTGPLYAGAYSIARFANEPPRTAPPYTLDTADDRDRLEGILLAMERPHWEYGWDELP